MLDEECVKAIKKAETLQATLTSVENEGRISLGVQFDRALLESMTIFIRPGKKVI